MRGDFWGANNALFLDLGAAYMDENLLSPYDIFHIYNPILLCSLKTLHPLLFESLSNT